MSKVIKRRRGGSLAHASFTGLEGEITVDTDKKTAVVHDGARLGGFALAREDLNNVTLEALLAKGLLDSSLSSLSVSDLASRGLATADLSNVLKSDVASLGVMLNDLSNADLSTAANEETAGLIKLASLAEVSSGINKTKAVTPATLAARLANFEGGGSASTSFMPQNYISGLAINFGSTGSQLVISPGDAMDASSQHMMSLPTYLTKNINAAWNAGSFTGGFAASNALTAGATYYISVISDGTNVDVGFDNSNTAANLLLASGYNYYRRIGAFYTNSDSTISHFASLNMLGESMTVRDLDMTQASTHDINNIMGANPVRFSCHYYKTGMEYTVLQQGFSYDSSMNDMPQWGNVTVNIYPGSLKVYVGKMTAVNAADVQILFLNNTDWKLQITFWSY